MGLDRGMNQHTPIVKKPREERMRLVAPHVQRRKANRLRTLDTGIERWPVSPKVQVQ